MDVRMLKKPRKTGKILGIGLSSTTRDGVLEFVEFCLKKESKFFISTPNPEIVVEARRNLRLKRALSMSSVALADGVGLLWANKFLGNRNKLTLLKGREVMIDLFGLSHRKGLKVFLLGASEEVNKRAVKELKAKYPNARVEGNSGPMLDKEAKPVSEVDSLRYSEVIKHINKFKPDLLFVAFGAPKQELWVMENFKKLKVGGVMVVGGSLDYFAGVKKLPPRVFSRCEWIWRLLREGGHWRRVINAVFVFPFWVVLAKAGICVVPLDSRSGRE